jgi:hypothetical protein
VSERDQDRILHEALQDDTDEKHGQHILDAVAAQEARRQGRAEDPVLEVLRQAHRARVEPPDDAA